jgi:hypothetical protein
VIGAAETCAFWELMLQGEALAKAQPDPVDL